MVKIKQLPTHKRPREKLIEKGPAGLNDAELIAVLLRTGVQGKSAIQLARELLKKIPLDKLKEAKLEDLSQVKGLGVTKAVQLLAALELADRVKEKTSELALTNPERVINLLVELKQKRKEYFIALYLNARHRLIYRETISVGHLTGSLVHPREVFKPALIHSAAAVILAHNHPSNDPQPSKDDVIITKKIVEAGKILDIPVEDHLIIAQQDWVSMRELGHIN